jgi:hypothetical protein
MVNPHPSLVERPAISGQMLINHNRLCGPCQAMFMTGGMDTVDIDEIGDYVHYSDGTAFIAAARSNRCYICTWTWRGAAKYGHQTVHHTTSRLIVEHEDYVGWRSMCMGRKHISSISRLSQYGLQMMVSKPHVHICTYINNQFRFTTQYYTTKPRAIHEIATKP